MAAAFLLYRRNGGQSSGAAPVQGVQRSGSGGFPQLPIFLLAIVIVAALLWLAVSMPTGLAALAGGIAALALAIGGMKAFAFPAASVSTEGATAADRPAARPALAMPIAFGIAVPSIGLLAIGSLYFFLIHRPAAFLQGELVDFGNIIGGLAIKASIVPLLIALIGGRLSPGVVDAPSPARDGRRSADDGSGSSVADLVSGVAGVGGDLLQSILCASAAAIVIAGTSGIFSVQRVEAVALPILLATAGLLTAMLAFAGTRVIKGRSPGSTLRLAGLAGTAIFLLLAFLVVTALGLEGRDPYTARRYLESGPFWAIFAGSLAGLLVALVSAFFTTGRPMRRLSAGGPGMDGTRILGALALGLLSAVTPLLLLTAATVAAFYLFGAYGIALAAVGMLGTVGIVSAAATLRPEFSPPPPGVRAEKAGRDTRTSAVGAASTDGSAVAIGRGSTVAVAGMTGIALFSAFVSATGLWAVGIDMHSPVVFAGLMIGTVVPVLLAAIVLSAMQGGTDGSSSARASGSAESAVLYRVGLPTFLLGVFLPVLVGYGLGVQALSALIATSVLSGTALALALANAGSALMSTRFAAPAEAREGSALSDGAANGDVLRLLADATPAVISTFVKMVAVSAIVLIPWFARML